MRDITPAITLLSAKAATGASDPILVDDYTHILLAIDTANSANLTVLVKGSVSDVAPDFTAAQTAANQWGYLQLVDLNDETKIDGDTGFAVAGSDDHRLFEVNINAMRWLAVHVSARSAGSVTVLAKPYSAV